MNYTLKDYKAELHLSSDFEFEERTELLISAIQTPVKLGVIGSHVTEAVAKSSVSSFLISSEYQELESLLGSILE